MATKKCEHPCPNKNCRGELYPKPGSIKWQCLKCQRIFNPIYINGYWDGFEDGKTSLDK